LKPASFEYHDPSTIEETLDLLAQFGDEAKLLAGGQSLVPAMNFRLARPTRLIDLNRVAPLSYLDLSDGMLRVGAMTRQRTVERSTAVAERWPLLVQSLQLVGHPQIRNRGTVGGSLAHADPAAELPAVMVALDATFVVLRHDGQRSVAAHDFFTTYMTTALQPNELLSEVRVPAPPPRTGSAFLEISRRHGDFAIVGVAALVSLDAADKIIEVRLALTGVGPTPVRLHDVESALTGQPSDAAVIAEACRTIGKSLEPDADLHATAEYRRHVAEVLVRRACLKAAERAHATSGA
jgi:probable selenate reductase FAD-binding subunit